MQASKLRESVRIEQRVRTSDGEGGETTGWEIFAAARPARIKPLAGGEVNVGERLQGRMNYEITMHYSSDVDGVTTVMRAGDARSGQTYAVTTVNHDERRRWFYLMVTRGAPG